MIREIYPIEKVTKTEYVLARDEQDEAKEEGGRERYNGVGTSGVRARAGWGWGARGGSGWAGPGRAGARERTIREARIVLFL